MEEKQLYINLYNGKIVKRDSEDKLKEEYIPISGPPKKNCKKCHERGYIGRNVKLNFYQICPCLRNKIEFDKIKKNEEKNETN